MEGKWKRYFPILYEQHVIIGDKRIEGRIGGYHVGFDYGRALGKPAKEEELKAEAALKPVDAPDVGKKELRRQEEKTYPVKGSQVTTSYNLRLEGLEVQGVDERMEFTGDASGTFTASANPLQRARLRTRDLQALCSRGTLFYFDFRPTRFEVRFFDPNNLDAPLGVLYADPVPPAGNPGSGSGKWTIPF